VAIGAAAEAAGDFLSRSGNFGQRKEEYSKDMTPRDGKVSGRKRAATCQEAIDMTLYMAGEGPETFWPNNSFRNCRTSCDERRNSIRRVRNDYAVEFSMAIPSWKMAPGRW